MEELHQKYDSGLLTFIGLVNEWIKKDLITKTVMKHIKKTPHDGGLNVPPVYLLKHHPILCGLIIHWIEIETRELGVALAMTYTTILSTAHLYNAARQSKFLPVA